MKQIMLPLGKVELMVCKSFTRFAFPRNRITELEKEIKEESHLLNQILNQDPSRTMELLWGKRKKIDKLRRFNGIAKIEHFVKWLAKQNKTYKKIVVFAEHQDTIEMLRIFGEEFKPLAIYPGTKEERLAARVGQFQMKTKFPVFICHLGAASNPAVNLKNADLAVFLEISLDIRSNAEALAKCPNAEYVNASLDNGLAVALDSYLLGQFAKEKKVIRRKKV